MKLQQRIHILVELGRRLSSNDEALNNARQRASEANSWFLPQFVDLAVENIVNEFLQSDKIESWLENYSLPENPDSPKTVGIVMAGNIPLVGFQDFLNVFVSGHRQLIKLSSRDQILMKYIAETMHRIDPDTSNMIEFAEILKNCDAYIATGSNNSARYFEQYFSKYPHIIRRNRTSIAIVDGTETHEELSLLADDIQLYFGLGCRNVSKIYVPGNYDFQVLLKTLQKYDFLMENHKYRNNYEYNLALRIMNNQYYMTNGSILLVGNSSPFSPISQLHYEYYVDKPAIRREHNGNISHEGNGEIQCVVGKGYNLFGKAQAPRLHDYADAVDTIRFLMKL